MGARQRGVVCSHNYSNSEKTSKNRPSAASVCWFRLILSLSCLVPALCLLFASPCRLPPFTRTNNSFFFFSTVMGTNDGNTGLLLLLLLLLLFAIG